ncbi:MAG TPA: SUMF1/EgtB/PvdO family nonheme iron enzyme [Gemmatimonadales bacterium]|nr:SUMF1/EgtB/PvdO family nonheme iron enzyme [Gemmatimonadales bacterium]
MHMAGKISLLLLAQNAPPPPPYRDSIPGTLVRFETVPVPAGLVTVPTSRGPRSVAVGAFAIGRTEVTWDEYDVWAFRLDLTPQERGSGVDATARPSRPYGAPDRGFGHHGYPALAMTYFAAQAYCAWLSTKTGKRYRLPTDAEWTRAVLLGLGGDSALIPERRDALGWHAGNAAAKAHPVAAKAADAIGLHDMLGNVGEWVTGTEGGGGGVVRGGSWVDPPEQVGPNARARQTPAWNETDPQFPKSRWWLADAPFVGFRIVREP